MSITIAVDFDGTLVQEDGDGYFHAIPGAREALQALRAQGYRVIIHTCRTGIAAGENRLQTEVNIIRQTLDHFGIPYDEIFTGMKMVADFYIDDRAVAFEGKWDETLQSLRRGITSAGA